MRLDAASLARYNRYGRELQKAMRDAPEDLSASYERFPELALRLAVLITVSDPEFAIEGELIVPPEALVAGIRHAEVARADAHKLCEIYSGVADEADIVRLVGLVKRSPGITRRSLQQNSHMRAATFNAALDAGVDDGRIVVGPGKTLHVPG